jgi:hypothetical protein
MSAKSLYLEQNVVSFIGQYGETAGDSTEKQAVHLALRTQFYLTDHEPSAQSFTAEHAN